MISKYRFQELPTMQIKFQYNMSNTMDQILSRLKLILVLGMDSLHTFSFRVSLFLFRFLLNCRTKMIAVVT